MSLRHYSGTLLSENVMKVLRKTVMICNISVFYSKFLMDLALFHVK